MQNVEGESAARLSKNKKMKGGVRELKVFVTIICIFLVLALLIGLSFGMGWFGVIYKNTIGVASASADRNIFKGNKSYVEGMSSDLAKYKYELSTEKDSTARKAIIELIIDKYGNFDINKLQDISLKQFLQDVRNGNYNEMEEK